LFSASVGTVMDSGAVTPNCFPPGAAMVFVWG
jgi:hypothetical protein